MIFQKNRILKNLNLNKFKFLFLKFNFKHKFKIKTFLFQTEKRAFSEFQNFLNNIILDQKNRVQNLILNLCYFRLYTRPAFGKVTQHF